MLILAALPVGMLGRAYLRGYRAYDRLRSSGHYRLLGDAAGGPRAASPTTSAMPIWS